MSHKHEEFVKVSDVAEGDRLIADGGFDCLESGELVRVCKDSNGELYVPCNKGIHHLNGQLGGPHGGFATLNYYVGFWKD